MHDKTHADANCGQETLGGQRALVVLAPPREQRSEDADVGQGIEHEDKPRAYRCHQNPCDRRSDRTRCIDGDAVQRDGGGRLVGRDELGNDRPPRRQHHRCADPEREGESEQYPYARKLQQGQDAKRAGNDQQIDLDRDQESPAIDDVGQRAGRHGEQHHWKTVGGFDERHQRR